MLFPEGVVLARRPRSVTQATVYGRTCAIGTSHRPTQTQHRRFTATSALDKEPQSSTTSPFRVYRYVVDHHGQLFLHDTVPKNLTSCFKNTDFLNFFYTRIRPNPSSLTASPDYSTQGSISRHDILNPPKDTSLPVDWSDLPPFNGSIPADEERSREELYQAALEMGNGEGYEWISPCGPELNLIRTQDMPIVYRELSDDGALKWAGTLTEPFRPEALIVDPENGYIYHPSPDPPSRKRREGRDKVESNKYGQLSLLGSNLVLSRLAEGLEIDPDLFEKGVGGNIEWQGRRYDLGLLSKHV